MAGKPGRSGGARDGAGRKPAPVVLSDSPDLSTDDPKAFLIALMNDEMADLKLRADAAKSLMPFLHKKLGEGGKKEQQQERASKIAQRFASAAPPKLVAAGGKKI